jgi:hypothetical protein
VIGRANLGLQRTRDGARKSSCDHYLLVRDGDNLRYNPLITLKYGRNYEDLVPYLNRLLNDPADPSARKKTSAESDSGV